HRIASLAAEGYLKFQRLSDGFALGQLSRQCEAIAVAGNENSNLDSLVRTLRSKQLMHRHLKTAIPGLESDERLRLPFRYGGKILRADFKFVHHRLCVDRD